MLQNEPPGTPDIQYAKESATFLLPAMLEITNVDPDFPWDDIGRQFRDLWIEKASKTVNGKFGSDPTLFLVIRAAIKGNESAIGYLHFLNKLFEELSDHLNDEQKKMICSTIKQLLKTPTYRFFDFVGELATLNNLLNSKIYQLERIEYPLENDKTIDFHLRRVEDGRSVLVEVVNIHIADSRVESDPIAINTFLSHRAISKRNKKEETLTAPIEYYLAIVLWGGWKSIQIYSNHFKTQNLNVDGVIEPLAYLQHSDGMGYYDHQFGRVSTLIFKNGQPVPPNQLQEKRDQL
jgi:hypothetical protein